MANEDYGRGRDYGNRGAREWGSNAPRGDWGGSEFDRGFQGREGWRGEWEGGRYGARGGWNEPSWRNEPWRGGWNEPWRGGWNEPYYGTGGDFGPSGSRYGGYYGGGGGYGGGYGVGMGYGNPWGGGYYGYPSYGGGHPGYGGYNAGEWGAGGMGYPGYGGSNYGYGATGYGSYGYPNEFISSATWRDRGYGSELGRGELGRGAHVGRGPRSYRRSDERIQEDINEQLTRHPGVDASDIDVRVNHGEVTLTGMVDDRNQKRLAEDVAESCSGVTDVHNQLRVERGRGQQADREVERATEREGRTTGERARGTTRSGATTGSSGS